MSPVLSSHPDNNHPVDDHHIDPSPQAAAHYLDMKNARACAAATTALRANTISRPVSLLKTAGASAIAGPSTCRYYASTADVPPTATTSLDASAPIQRDLLESSVATPPKSARLQGQLPPNVVFEGFEEGEGIEPKKELGGSIIHHHHDPLGPIEMPISSLASDFPTRAAPSGDMIELPAEIFAKPMRKDILHRCVVWYLANLRQGSQSTKSRSTVAYSGKKLLPQKGTGKARVGDASSGVRRGGAPIFPLHPRDHTQLLPRKIRTLGLFTALSSKLGTGLLRVVPSLSEAGWEGTNVARRALSNDITWKPVEGGQEEMQIGERFGKPSELSILFIRAGYDETFERVIRNIEGVEVLDIEDVQVWHLLKYKWCVMEKDVVDVLSGEGSADTGLGDLGLLDAGAGSEVVEEVADLKI